MSLKARKLLRIEEKREVAATREKMLSWYEGSVLNIYEKYGIKFNWQIWNMDETMAALLVSLNLQTNMCFLKD